MDIHEYNIEAIKIALDETGEPLSEEAIENIACFIESNYENMEMLTGPVENPLKAEINKLNEIHATEIAYHKERDLTYRKSVAKRRGVNSNDVWIENGDVMYK